MIAKINQPAPEFSLLDSDGNMRTLSEFKGKNIVLYFFPKADTPGCTKEACAFRDATTLYKRHGIVVLGISYDSPEILKRFKKKYTLPFILLSDDKKEVAKTYGAYKTILNTLYPERITFLINKDGIITHILNHVNVTTHAEDILALLTNTR